MSDLRQWKLFGFGCIIKKKVYEKLTRTIVAEHFSRWSYKLYFVLAQQILDERQVMEPRTKNREYPRHSLEVNTIKCFVCCCSSRRLLAWQSEELVPCCLLLRHRWVLQELRYIHHKTIGAIAESFPRLIMPGKGVNLGVDSENDVENVFAVFDVVMKSTSRSALRVTQWNTLLTATWSALAILKLKPRQKVSSRFLVKYSDIENVNSNFSRRSDGERRT